MPWEVSGEQKASVSTSWEQVTSFQPRELGLQGYGVYRFSTLPPAHPARMQGTPDIWVLLLWAPLFKPRFSCLFQEVVASEKGPHVVLLVLGCQPWASVLVSTLRTTYSQKTERHKLWCFRTAFLSQILSPLRSKDIFGPTSLHKKQGCSSQCP